MDKTPDSLGKIEQLLDEIADTEAEDIKAWERKYQEKQDKLEDEITKPMAYVCQMIYDLSLENEVLDLDIYARLSELASVVVTLYLLEGTVLHLYASKNNAELSKELYEQKLKEMNDFLMNEFRQEIMANFGAIVRNFSYEDNLHKFVKDLDSKIPSISPENKS